MKILATIWQDVSYSARALRRSPGFSLAAVLSLALGIGASTAVFSIPDTVFLRPLPYPDSDRLLWIAVDFPSIKNQFLPSPDYVVWRRENRVFEQFGTSQATPGFTMTLGGSEPTEVHIWRGSFNFLLTLGMSPSLGRAFRPEEELPNGPRAVLLTDLFWREHFHSDRRIVGGSIVLDGQNHTVAGVLPSGFRVSSGCEDRLADHVARVSERDSSRSCDVYLGGLWTPETGRDHCRRSREFRDLFAASKADAPLMFRQDNRLIVESLQQHRVGNARILLLVLSGAVACLLLIACANVANLFLARWSDRSRELAVRAAVGATRLRLVRQLFTEAVLLALLGCGGGVLLALITLRGFVHFAAGELPRLAEVSLDARVAGIAVAVSVLMALLFGGLPALRAGRVDLQPVLQQGGRMAGGYRGARRLLVAGEVALSMILVSGAALLFETLWHLENDHLGFRPEHVMTAAIPLRGSKLEAGNRKTLADDVLAVIRRLPGTEAADVTQCTPLTGGPALVTFSRSDRPLPEPFHRGANLMVCGVGPEYFRAAGIRLTRGRFLLEKDFEHPATLALINEAAARAYFPGEDPLGRQIARDTQGRWKTVFGVVADAKNQANLSLPAVPQMFVNDPGWANASQLLFIVRSGADEQSLVSVIRSEVHSLDPGLFVKFQTLDQASGELSAGPRFHTILLASFAALAFLMAMFGVYAVLSFAVVRRTPEIGIRMALGADRWDVTALVVREAALLVGIGTIAGLCGAFALTRYLKTLLYDVSANDPATYAVVLLGLAIAAALAALWPSRRASSIDPMQAIRHE